mgnify:CR=1 FL=1
MTTEKMKSRLKDFITLSWWPLISNRTKCIISALLLIFAFLVRYAHPDWPGVNFCFLAMCFSFIGDVCLNCMPIHKRPHSLLYAGAASFMVGHIFYVLAYLEMIKANSYEFFNLGTYLAISFMIIFFIMSAVLAIKQGTKPIMLIVFGVYILVIGFNFVTICSYSYSASLFVWVGALSFLGSDFIIGLENVFKLKKPLLRKLVWILYPVGQFMLLWLHH